MTGLGFDPCSHDFEAGAVTIRPVSVRTKTYTTGSHSAILPGHNL